MLEESLLHLLICEARGRVNFVVGSYFSGRVCPSRVYFRLHCWLGVAVERRRWPGGEIFQPKKSRRKFDEKNINKLVEEIAERELLQGYTDTMYVY